MNSSCNCSGESINKCGFSKQVSLFFEKEEGFAAPILINGKKKFIWVYNQEGALEVLNIFNRNY